MLWNLYSILVRQRSCWYVTICQWRSEMQYPVLLAVCHHTSLDISCASSAFSHEPWRKILLTLTVWVVEFLSRVIKIIYGYIFRRQHLATTTTPSKLPISINLDMRYWVTTSVYIVIFEFQGMLTVLNKRAIVEDWLRLNICHSMGQFDDSIKAIN